MKIDSFNQEIKGCFMLVSNNCTVVSALSVKYIHLFESVGKAFLVEMDNFNWLHAGAYVAQVCEGPKDGWGSRKGCIDKVRE